MLQLKLSESMNARLPQRIPRDVRLPTIPNKVLAVVGVRRGGKTSLLYNILHDNLATGRPRDSQLLVSLEDERLVGMTAEDLGWLLEEHWRRAPDARSQGRRSVYLDEVHVVDQWEYTVRRLMDAHDTDVYVSGSSAKLLSSEVHTSLRGRSMEVQVFPYSFRESLRHASSEPDGSWADIGPTERAALDNALRNYLQTGGFPEAQKADVLDRLSLLKGYVDLMVLRDVIERFDVRNVEVLRRLQRHLLANPGAQFSVSKFHRDLRSQGVAVGQEALFDMMGFLEDAFMIRPVSMYADSESKRNRNPRKVYPIDPGLISVYERAGRENHGRRLENAVLLELQRRGYHASWARADKDLEVDFLAEHPVAEPLLMQVALDVSSESTLDREVRALEAAARIHPDAMPLLITLDFTPPARPLPAHLRWQSATEWLLETPGRIQA